MRLVLPGLAGAFAVVAIAMPLAAGAAPDQSVPGSQQVTQAAANLTQMTRVHHACTVIMGLDDPGELYNICVSNLIRSLRELEQAGLVSTDRRTCRKERLETGTPAFADCILDAEQPLVSRGQ
jgi:hypothetical protein